MINITVVEAIEVLVPAAIVGVVWVSIGFWVNSSTSSTDSSESDSKSLDNFHSSSIKLTKLPTLIGLRYLQDTTLTGYNPTYTIDNPPQSTVTRVRAIKDTMLPIKCDKISIKHFKTVETEVLTKTNHMLLAKVRAARAASTIITIN